MKFPYIALGLLLSFCIAGCSPVSESAPNSNSQQAGTAADAHANLKNDGHLVSAQQFLSNGDYDKAIKESDKSIAANPNNAEAYSIRGFATALNGDTEKGLADTKKSYQLDPNNVANYYNMAMVYKLGGQLNDSKQWFEMVLEKDPSNTWSIYGIATIYADQGDDVKALDWLERAIESDASVKAVAAEQDHFERFHGNPVFEKLVQ